MIFKKFHIFFVLQKNPYIQAINVQDKPITRYDDAFIYVDFFPEGG